MIDFAVANEFEVRTIQRLSVREEDCITQERATRTRIWKKGWITEVLAGTWELTDAGRVALELALAMDGNTLTKPMARSLFEQVSSGRVFRGLLRAGLVDEGDALTLKGERVAKILHKYQVDVW